MGQMLEMHQVKSSKILLLKRDLLTPTCCALAIVEYLIRRNHSQKQASHVKQAMLQVTQRERLLQFSLNEPQNSGTMEWKIVNTKYHLLPDPRNIVNGKPSSCIVLSQLKLLGRYTVILQQEHPVSGFVDQCLAGIFNTYDLYWKMHQTRLILLLELPW